MYEKLRNVMLLPSLTLPFITPNFDNVQESKLTKQMQSVLQQETGWDRLHAVFRRDDFGRLTPEATSIIEVASLSAAIGLLYGGITSSREAYIDFIKNNQATVFKNHLDAKKSLQDKITLSFAKGGFMWAWRLTFFSSTYVCFTTSISAYRGKNGILEHTAAGLIAGSLYKFKLGPKAMLVGGGLGMVLGTMAGILQQVGLKMTGSTMDEIRYWNYQWASKRTEKWTKGLEEHKAKEDLQLIKERDLKRNLQNLENMEIDKVD